MGHETKEKWGAGAPRVSVFPDKPDKVFLVFGAWDLSNTPAPFGGSVRRVEDTRRQSRGSGGGWEK